MKAMLLAAGRSTRLGAIGQALPKPLVPICGYPAIQFGLAACAHAGLAEVVVNTHHHAERLAALLGDGTAFGLKITLSHEPDLLGTAGGIARGRMLFGDGAVVVMNAKVVADLDLTRLIAAHVAHAARVPPARAGRSAAGLARDAHTAKAASAPQATLVVRDDPDARRWGAIGVDAADRIVRILDVESPLPPVGPVVERMFTGIQVLEPAILDRMRPIFSDSVRDAFIPALRDGADLRAFTLPGYFAEHSTPERYLAGNFALLRHPGLLAAPPGPLTGIAPDADVSPDARLVPPYRIAGRAIVRAGAVLGPDVVVGTGAVIQPGAQLRRVIVWPDSTVGGTLVDAVVTPEGVVQVDTST